MAKNYKKLYNALKRNLRNELKVIKEYSSDLNNRTELVDKIECDGQISFLSHLFEEYLPELEGKKWGSVCLNLKEFKKWKKEINVK